jgi:hypothetical protein
MPKRAAKTCPVVSVKPAAAPMARMDSPQGDHHDQPVPLGEVRGVEMELFGAEEERSGPVDEDRQDPDRGLGAAVEQARDDEQRRAEQEPRREPENCLQIRFFRGAGHVPDVSHP